MSLFAVVVVPPQKITHYLLSLTSRDGKGKARFFFGYGFTVEDWEILADSLKRHAAENPVTKTETTDYGTRYVIEGTMRTPDGRNPQLRSVWLVENVGESPRFVTAYPRQQEMVQELDSVVLLRDLPENGLSANDVGTVVHVYKNNAAYEVEFVALNGQTIAVTTIPAAQVRPVRPLEVAQVRQLVAV